MTPEEATRIAAHRTLGELYEARAKAPDGTWGDVREAIDNFMLAGEAARAWPLVETIVRALSPKGLREEALSLLVRCEERGLTGDLLSRCLLLQHDLRASLGVSVDDLAADLGRALAAAEGDAAKGLCVHRLGRLATEQGNLEAAAGLLEQAAGFAAAAFGEGHAEHAAALHDLGAVLASQGRIEEAEKVLSDAVTAGERLMAAGALDPPVFGAWLKNLATVLAARGRLEESEAMLRRALSLVEGQEPKGAAYGALLKDLSDVLAARGAHEEAEILAGRAVLALEAALGPTHPMLATALSGHADRLRALGQSFVAEGALRRALSLYSDANGARHPTSVELFVKLAQAEIAAGNPNGLDSAERALVLMDEVLGPNHAFSKENAPILRSMIHLVAPERLVSEEGQASLFAFYEAEIARGMKAIEARDGAAAIEILLPIAEQAHDAGITHVEAVAASLLAQAFALSGEISTAVTCASRAVVLAGEAGNAEAQKRFSALLEVLRAEAQAAPASEPEKKG